MVIAVTISRELRKMVSGRSSTTRRSTARPSWSVPVTPRVRRGASGSGAIAIASLVSNAAVSAGNCISPPGDLKPAHGAD